MSKSGVFLAVFVASFLFSVVMIAIPLFGEGSITGHATSGSTISNVTIVKAYSITLSSNLTDGVQFSNLSGSTITNANATENYGQSGTFGTGYLVNVSDTSTISVDFCISGNTDLIDPSSLDIIGLGNETYSNASTTSNSIPQIGDETPLTTTATKSGIAIQPGNGNHYRFWLDVPASVPSGNYNNTLTFAGVETTDACV